MSLSVLPMFSSKSFIDYGLIFRTLIHFEFIFVYASKVMLKILQARLQQYMNRELPDIQAGFRKGRGTRDQLGNIFWIQKSKRVPEKHLFLLY